MSVTFEYLRSFKVFGYAIFDIVSSFVGIALLSPLLTRLFRYIHLEIPFLSWIYLTLPIGILVHLIVGNNTPMVKQFLDPSGFYLLKIVVIVLCILAVRLIKKI